MAQIHEAIAALMADCPAIGKDQKNAQQGFMYRGVDTVMNALQPLMIKHGIFVAPEVIDCERQERVTRSGSALLYTILRVRYTFFAKDGSSVSAVVQGEGMDSADKSSNKAMSVAFKYACFQVFCIPTEEMHDPDAETPPPSEKLYKCAVCGKDIEPQAIKGKYWTSEALYMASAKKCATIDGKGRCANCMNALRAEQEAAKQSAEKEERQEQ